MSDRLSPEAVKALEGLAAFILGKGGEAQKDIVWPHGTDGLLTYPGVRPDMYNLTPRVGTFIGQLPILPSRFETALFEFITGVTAQTGDNPTGYCATPPKSGKMKVGQILATFGQFFKGTDEINAMQAGRLKNRADVPRRIRNPGGYGQLINNPFVPMPVGATAESFNTITGKTFLEFGQGAMLDFAYALWRGDKTKNNTQTYRGFIKEFDGFDKWIKTGYTDVVSGAATPSIDSQVVNYNATVGSSFVLALSNVFRTLRTEAELKNTPNALWYIVMHPRAKFPIYDAWACNYMTARCLPTEANGQRLDQTQINNLRDEMIRGDYLLIDGERVPVFYDAGIEATQAEATGVWTSDVYIIPMDDGIGNPLSYFEYMPRDAVNNDELGEIMQLLAPGQLRVMNGGLYLAGFIKREAFCFSWQFGAELRLIVERPDLAGRVDNVSFTSNTPFSDPYPGATYHKNGGTTFRVG